MYTRESIEESVRVLSAVLEDRYLKTLGNKDDMEESSLRYGHTHDFYAIAEALGFDASDPYNIRRKDR
jgi:thiamine pyrophosphate-dependent acetolactate synthase large subunit-like protein